MTTTNSSRRVTGSRPAAPSAAQVKRETATCVLKDGYQAIRAGLDKGRGDARMDDGDRTRLAGREGDRPRALDRQALQRSESGKHTEEAANRLDSKITTQSLEGAAPYWLGKNEVVVREDSQERRDLAQLDRQEVTDSKLRDDRKNEGQELSEEEQRVDDDVQVKTEGKCGEIVSQTPLHQQPLQQGSVVRWERFLPKRQLRILLVEDDDCTRQVVGALLRNCSYEVNSVANGLQAWELLGDPTNHFDLVLTEVVMPCLSGIGLLCKILAHQACKHIPVIMMSSHDSMGIVFKCLSKGAVDFLVKPVRKNELKNLWQHVWRRCRSSSGSRSGSGSQTQNALQPKSGVGSGNNTGSNDESDNASSGLNVRDGSDNGSGTQSSWTKRAVEVESPRQRSNWDLARPHIGPSTEVPKQKLSEKLQRSRMQQESLAGESFVHQGCDIGQDLEIAITRPAAVEPKYLKESNNQLDSACAVDEIAPSTGSGEGEKMEEDPAGTGTRISRSTSTKAIDLIGNFACQDKLIKEEQDESGDKEVLVEKEFGKTSNSKDKTISDSNSLPMLELTLKRARPTGEVEGEDRRILKHSGSSAFSRYNTSANSTPLPPNGSFPVSMYHVPAPFGGHPFIQGNCVGSSSQTAVRFAVPAERVGSSKASGEVTTRLPMHTYLSHGSNNQGVSSSAAGPAGPDCYSGPVSMKEAASPLPGPGVPMPIPLPPTMSYEGVPAGYDPRHPMFYSHPVAPHWGPIPPHVADRGEAYERPGSLDLTESHNVHSPTRRHSHHHHSHHHHHHIQHHHHHHHQQPSERTPLASQPDDQTVTNVEASAPRCGSSNMVNGLEGNNGQSGSSNGYGSNCNGNGSATGSNNASNGNHGNSNGQSAMGLAIGGIVDSGTQNGSSATGTGNGGTVGNIGNGVAAGSDHNRFARREAALTKFRQKRKERCFEKKVRYQSRKRLAEQRPRVRGQFVRQSVYESTVGEPE